MNLIVPMAGRSSRYPNMRPKWMLAHPNGRFMAIQAIMGLNPKSMEKIVFVYLREHEEKFHFKKGFIDELERLGIANYSLCQLEEQTKDVTETVLQAISLMNLKGSILIKDSDAYFSCDNVPDGNFVFYSHLKNTKCTKPASSSYITLNENNIITNIVEKQIISPNICVGGYAFESADDFVKVASELKSSSERYISDIIYFTILNKKGIFRGIEINDLEDWGTLGDWKNYQKKFATLFIDIDGVIVRHSSTHFPPYIGESGSLEKNVEFLKSLCNSGEIEIILTTSRSEEHRRVTETQLRELGLKWKDLIMGLQHCKRIIINDYSSTNPYKSCDSINIKRDSDDLQELMAGLFI